MTSTVTRLLDITLSALGLLVTLPIMTCIFLLGLIDTGKPIFRQTRVGLNQRNFTLIKFRTMRIETISTPSHLARKNDITTLGRILRRTKLDELPQLWNVLKGEMSLIGPRPCLPQQTDLINERLSRDIFRVRPGITGLAQVSGIDMSTPKLLAETEAKMLATLCVQDYFLYLFRTVFGAGSGDSVRN